MEENDNDFMQDMEQLLDEHDYALPEVGDIRTGIVVSITPQGVIVDLGLKRDGIIQPVDLEKLTKEEREAIQPNDEILVYILSTDVPDSLIVSRHMALLNQDWIRAEQLLESGEIFEGEIVGYNRGGVLVAFGGLRGFIPASHLSMLSPNLNDKQRQQRLSKLRDEIVPVKVIEVDRQRRRLVLSQRDAEKEWRDARRQVLMEKINPGDVITGRVTGWRDFGAFVDLGGVDGLVHVSELAWYRVNHPREAVQIGDEVQVYVLRVDREKERISLSRKKLLPNPWSLVEERYVVGQLVEGKIIRIVDYGAFIELEPGVEGLLHVSQISRTSVTDPHEVVAEGETHLLRIISVDPDRERIGLSLKAVRAQEQIEWMTQRELEVAEESAPEATDLAPIEETAEEELVESEVAAELDTVIEEVEEAVEEAEVVEVAEVVEEVGTAEAETMSETVEDVDQTVEAVYEAEEIAAEASEIVETGEDAAEPVALEDEGESSENGSDDE